MSGLLYLWWGFSMPRLGRLLGRAAKNALKTVNQVTDTVTDLVEPAVHTTGDLVGGVTAPLAGVAGTLTGPLEGPVAAIANPLVEGVAGLVSGLEQPVAQLTGGLAGSLAPLTGALEPLADALDPLLSPVTDPLSELVPNTLETSILVLGLGLVLDDLIDDLGVEALLGPVADLAQPVDALVGAINLTPLYDAVNGVLEEAIDPANALLEAVSAALPDPVEELLTDLPALGVIGETERPVFFIPYEEGGLLSDLANDVLGEDGLGLVNLGEAVDGLNEALAPLGDLALIGDTLGGTGVGFVGIIPVRTDGQIGLGLLFDTVDIEA